MAIIHLKEAKALREQGSRLGRAGMSRRVIHLVKDFIENDGSYKGAMKLAGRLKAIAIAAKCDSYWDEMVGRGYDPELWDIKNWEIEPPKEEAS